MKGISCFCFTILSFCLPLALAFRPSAHPTSQISANESRRQLFFADQHQIVSESTSILISLLKKTDPDIAKGEFYFTLGAGSGAGGIGIAQLPRIYKELSRIRALGTEGPSDGGSAVEAGLSSLIFPTIYDNDVKKAIASAPTAKDISKQGQSTSYLASKGYIDRDDFIFSLKGCNPLASYALFEAISGGSGGVCSPDKVDEKIALYREAGAEDGITMFARDLSASSMTKLGAYGGLCFLLLLIFVITIENGINAFLSS